MRLFGQKRDPSTAHSGAGGGGVSSFGGGGGGGGGEKERMWRAGWFRAMLTFCTVLVVLAGCFEIYRRATAMGTRMVEAQPVDASIRIVNLPPRLDRALVKQILQEAYTFAQRDEATMHRVRNVLDNDVLKEMANLYTGVDVVNGKQVSRQARGYNAWIKRVTTVRRVVAKDKSSQEIQIVAEWRTANAWVKAGDTFYLMDGEGVRLPGDYSAADRSRMQMMAVTGLDLPVIGGQARVPLPGEKWVGRDGSLGADYQAGMALAEALEGQVFAGQIEAIDMGNFQGRRDPLQPWILLNTIWKTADGRPRVIQWGRPMGAETFYEVKASAKIKVLNELFLRFNRIDADRDYVDIRAENPRLPKLATQVEPVVPVTRG